MIKLSKLLGSYIFKKELTTGQEIMDMIDRVDDIIRALTMDSDKIREHTRFHIFDNINYALIHINTALKFKFKENK